jgi:hypothetical protein
MGGQINRDEGAEAGLDVGDEEIEPVEAAQTALRRGLESRRGRLVRRRRRPRRIDVA